MQTRARDVFLTVRTEGAILPSDLLERIATGDQDLGGLTPDSYHLPEGEKITETTNRAWNRLLAAWSGFRHTSERLADTETGTTLTREKWLLPLFQELGYGRLLTAKATEIGGKSYAISHGWHRTPIHLLGCRIDLNTSSQRVAGASRSSPHSLVQEFLNRSPDHLWGMVSNGLRLRVLRDNARLTRQSYVEFDLEAMMQGEAYADFVLLWLLCHQSRLEAESPSECWLEKWSQSSHDRGIRALEQLRTGVEEAIRCLGRGFLAHLSNRALRERLRSGELDAQDYYRQVLRLVYRLLFLFVAEDRELLLLPGENKEAARLRYVRYYSTSRLRRLAERRTGTRHGDLYETLRLAMQKLGSDAGCPELALPALGSFLFSPEAMPDIENCEIANHDLLDAVRALAVTVADGARRSVDYKNLGAEELGSVYESLLELCPELNLDAPSFGLTTASGHERKTSGSYYTPTSLIDCLLDTALEPVLDEAAKKPDAEAAILKLNVVDPACGSGHFLIAAAHRMAKRLAAARTGDEEPSPEALRKALRDVIGHCIYGVDLNPMAVELCKVNLWMEALEPGKPLSFLEHRIQPGNALLGAMPSLMDNGIPDAAFNPIEGDLKEACTKWRKANKSERTAWEKKQGWLGFDAPLGWLMSYATGLAALDSVGDEAISGIREKERRYTEAVRSRDYLDGKFLADSWCAAFVWRKDSLTEFPITEQVYRELEKNPVAFYQNKSVMSDEVRRLARQYSFFHWHLAFPDVFRPSMQSEEAENRLAGWNGGFDVVLGNPPWERIKLQEREWFASRRPDIADAPNAAARRRMIEALDQENPSLLAAFRDDLRTADGESHLLRNSGRFPLCGKGDINTYAVFAETNRTLLSRHGRVGCIVPSGIATDNTTKEFFAEVIESNTLVSLYDFENAVGLFEGVGHGRFKFCLLTLAGSARSADKTPDFLFFAHHTTDLDDQDRHFTLSAEDIALINPNTRTCPIFRSKRDAEITKAIYHGVPVLIKEGPPEENPWGIRFQRMFDMSNDSHQFRTREQLESQGFEPAGNVFVRGSEKYLPLYEAKMMHHFTHRYGDYAMRPEGSQDTELPRIPAEKLRDPNYVVLPRYWVQEWEVIKATSNVPKLVIQAVESGSEDLARQILSAWFAGYALAQGREKDANTLLIRNVLNVWDSMEAALQTRFAAMALHEEYPLDETDFFWDTPGMTFLEAAERLIRKRTPKWLLGFRDICRATDERTAIFAVLPAVAVGHKAPLMYVRARDASFLVGAFSSVVFDYATRQNVGGTSLGYFVLKQLPVPDPRSSIDIDFVRSRVLELAYTASDLAGFARDNGWSGTPFSWDDGRRFVLRCELDALFFHVYGIARSDVDYIMDTFPIVRRKDEQQFGEYRTKRVILEIYDAMAEAQRMGVAYRTRLDPPPADPRVAHTPAVAERIQPTPVPRPMLVPSLDLVANGVWATPAGIRPDNFVVLTLTEVLHRFGTPTDPNRVWLAVHFVRNPAMALAFLDKAAARDWMRVIGSAAQPIPKNVADISRFQRDPRDRLWGDAIIYLKSIGALSESSGLWSLTAAALAPADEEWLAGRAECAVRLASKLADEQETELRLAEFLRSVEDGTAGRAVS
ncbi:MAG: N-6 DNA methylase [Bryobacterales bacterium]|nr:N-6 DNA methylase [Bryobacterales bacterium]